MSCCTSYIELCDISSCDEWITTTIEAPEIIPVEYLTDLKVSVMFNGVKLKPQTRVNGDGYLEIKNEFAPNYTYVLKIINIDSNITCYQFNIQQNINL